MKKIFNLVSTILLIYFSFYYTNVVSNYVKNKDPIMIQIKNIESKYYKAPMNATILENTIIPGERGETIDIDNSYLKMKKINNYLESMLVFKNIEPDISIKNNFDKLIISGNLKKNNVSILVKVDDLNLLKKINLETNLKTVGFILKSSFIKENQEYLEKIKNNIVILETDHFTNHLEVVDYCYTTKKELEGNCSKYKKHTILVTLITHDYYYNTSQTITNGSILGYNLITEKDIQELNVLLSGVKNLGYKIVPLKELLKE